MSEEMSVRICIGGNLPKNLVAELLQDIEDSVCEVYDGIGTKEELLKEATGKDHIVWHCTSNYGSADDVESFCVKHKLTYTLLTDHWWTFWKPGMKESLGRAVDADGYLTIRTIEIRPYTDLLLAMALHKENALPMFLSADKTSTIGELVERGLKMPYEKFVKSLEKDIAELAIDDGNVRFNDEYTVPPLVIVPSRAKKRTR